MAHPEVGLICQTIGRSADEGGFASATVIKASPKLVQAIKHFELSPSDFGQSSEGETIELRAKRESHWDRGERLEYIDTETTLNFRDQMRAINKILAQADIKVLGLKNVDSSQRRLRRCFTCGRFDHGGRLYGGFWQGMKKRDRLQHIRINGEQVVELDYGQIMPRLVYSLADGIPEMDDLYAIPGFKDCRPGIKKVMSSMQFVEQRLTRFPKGTRDLFPRDVKVEDVVSAIEAAHPLLSPYFFTGIGHQCQFLESQIMVEVLRHYSEWNIPVLPIHDAILVPVSEVARAKKVMLYTFQLKTGGQQGIVDVLTLDQLEAKHREELQLVAIE